MSSDLERKASELGAEITSSTTSTLNELKPLLRGWLHALATVIAVPLTIGLVARTMHDTPRMIAMLVYGIGMVQLYAVSALYHIGSWRGRWLRFIRNLDHANIFVMIAGTYTPLCVALLTGWLRLTALLTVWIAALTGILLTVLFTGQYRRVRTTLYVGMAVIPSVLTWEIVRALPLGATALLITGGLLYMLGALVYTAKRPNPLPRVFGFHEIFHVLVVGAGAAFAAAIWVWVVPYS